MSKLSKAKQELERWQEQYRKEYKHYHDSWQYNVVTAANKCKALRKEIEKLEGTNV